VDSFQKQNAILKVRHQVIKACRDFFDNNGFTLVDTPIFTANACEGTSNLFAVDYFERSAYLTQSGQLYSEATAAALGKVYCFGPTFRAEKSKTRRHLTEFWMVEPEMAYCNLDENMDVAEQFVEYIVQWCLEHCKDELEILERNTSGLEKVKHPSRELLTMKQQKSFRTMALTLPTGRTLAEQMRLYFISIRSTGHGAPLACRDQSILHETGCR